MGKTLKNAVVRWYMERRTLLERIGVVAATGVLVGCLDDRAVSDDDGPAAGGDGGDRSGNGNGESNVTDGGNGTDGSDDGSTSNGGGSDDGDDSDAGGTDGTDDGSATNSSDDGSGDDELEDGETENGENETVGADGESDDSGGDVRSSVETTNTDCYSDGADRHGATVEFGEDRLVVTGHLEAPNPCHEAVLETATVRDGAMVLEIGLEAEDGFCTECVGRIEYEATVEVADGAPDEVVVYHRSDDDRTEVATAGR